MDVYLWEYVLDFNKRKRFYVFMLILQKNFYTYKKIKIQWTFHVALVIETVASVSITGKFETLGSNFSQGIRKAKLLASIATIPKVRCILILVKDENNLFMKFT